MCNISRILLASTFELENQCVQEMCANSGKYDIGFSSVLLLRQYGKWQFAKKYFFILRRNISAFVFPCPWRDNSILIQMTKISENVNRNYLQKEKKERDVFLIHARISFLFYTSTAQIWPFL